MFVRLLHVVSGLFRLAGGVCGLADRFRDKLLTAYSVFHLVAARCTTPALLFEREVSMYIKHGLRSSQIAPGHQSRACTHYTDADAVI